MCGDGNNCSSCISEILRKILILQGNSCNNELFSGCDKPYLGPITSTNCYNTRPIQLYNCCIGTPWTFDLTGDITGTSDIFRIEALDDCCCTCRLLFRNTDTGELTNTNEFCTIDLKCCGAIRCLPDTYIELC